MMQNDLGLCLSLINEELPAQGKALKSWEILSLCEQTAKERESGRKVSAIEEGEGLAKVHTHMRTLSLSLSLSPDIIHNQAPHTNDCCSCTPSTRIWSLLLQSEV
jgi:hypothetical protein